MRHAGVPPDFPYDVRGSRTPKVNLARWLRNPAPHTTLMLSLALLVLFPPKDGCLFFSFPPLGSRLSELAPASCLGPPRNGPA